MNCQHYMSKKQTGIVPIGTEKKPGNPRRSPAHLLTHGIKGNSHSALNNQFIMHMTADKAMRQGSYRMSQNIPAYCLHDIFDKLWTVTFDALPLLRTTFFLHPLP